MSITSTKDSKAKSLYSLHSSLLRSSVLSSTHYSSHSFHSTRLSLSLTFVTSSICIHHEEFGTMATPQTIDLSGPLLANSDSETDGSPRVTTKREGHTKQAVGGGTPYGGTSFPGSPRHDKHRTISTSRSVSQLRSASRTLIPHFVRNTCPECVVAQV